MRIVDESVEVSIPLEVKGAEFFAGYKLKLSFSDGKEEIVDFESFLKRSKNPHIRKYLDPSLFRSFELTQGNVNWNDYDLIFPVADLYNGKL